MTPAASSLFSGAHFLRVPSERVSFVLTLASLGITIPLLGMLLGHAMARNEIALVLIGGILFVTIARGRLLGSSIRVHARQFGATHEIIEEYARRLALPTPEIYVRDDYVTPIVAVSGQTFGMFVFGLRVVNAENRRVGIGGAAMRYVCAIFSVFLVHPIFRVFAHVQPYEKLSRTRLLAQANTGAAVHVGP